MKRKQYIFAAEYMEPILNGTYRDWIKNPIPVGAQCINIEHHITTNTIVFHFVHDDFPDVEAGSEATMETFVVEEPKEASEVHSDQQEFSF